MLGLQHPLNHELAGSIGDRAGAIGLQHRPLDARRLLGAALLVAGTVLVAL